MLKTTIAIFATLMITGVAFAVDHNPNKIREMFALSGDDRLQLAADALGDDQLVKMLGELKSDEAKDPKIQKILKKLR